MTVIVQQSTDSNGNPQPMVHDSDTGKIIVDSNGYVINGGKRLVNVPTKADYVNTPKTTSSGLLEAWEYAYPNNLEIVLVGDISINKNITLSATVNGNGSFELYSTENLRIIVSNEATTTDIYIVISYIEVNVG